MTRRSVRDGVRAGLVRGWFGPVGRACFAVGAVGAGPVGGGGDRHLEPFRSPSQWPAVVVDAAGQAESAGRGRGRGCVSVGHEGLRWSV